jgi:hypothetical protein
LKLVHQLRTVAALSLDPLPEYQYLSTASGAFDDKLIVIMREAPSVQRTVAFVSALYLKAPLQGSTADEVTVVRVGLTCIAPDLQRYGLTATLFFRLFTHLRAQPEFARGVPVTALAEVPSSLGSIAQYATDVCPSPGRVAPSPKHLSVADVVSERYRNRMLIAPEAMFDRKRFVFRGPTRLSRVSERLPKIQDITIEIRG